MLTYIIVATIWSIYQGGRGIVEHWRLDGKDYPGWKGVVVLYIHDFVFRAVCTAAGFFALYGFYHIVEFVPYWANVPEGTAALLAGSFVVGVIGVGGQLHYVILLGKVKAP